MTIILTPEQHTELCDLLDALRVDPGDREDTSYIAAAALRVLDDAAATLVMCALPDDTVWH